MTGLGKAPGSLLPETTFIPSATISPDSRLRMREREMPLSLEIKIKDINGAEILMYLSYDRTEV